MMYNNYDIIIIGAGPAGMAASIAAAEQNSEAKIALIEREAFIGGILKQCIHDGFGLVKFKERLTGPEYAWRYRDMVQHHKNIHVFISTFVTKIEKTTEGFDLTFTNPENGVFNLSCTALISATGCRERTDRQIFIHGSRPSGVFTAGQAQSFINIKGYIPGNKFVILGSGDIGLIMARRITLETSETGGEVEGVYEVKPEPSGLTRNIVQCLNDYNIPLHLSTSVIKLHGKDRLEGVTVATVDANMKPIAGTERYIECDTLILSVGLIPENEILESLVPMMDMRTKGPAVNQYMETSVPGLFACGNSLHVNDLVDYVSESGAIAGKRAAELLCTQNIPINKDKKFKIEADKSLLYNVPSNIVKDGKKVVLFFRAAKTYQDRTLMIYAHKKNESPTKGVVIFKKKYAYLKPPEMERLVINTDIIPSDLDSLYFKLEKE